MKYKKPVPYMILYDDDLRNVDFDVDNMTEEDIDEINRKLGENLSSEFENILTALKDEYERSKRPK